MTKNGLCKNAGSNHANRNWWIRCYWDCSSAASTSFVFLWTPIFDIMTNVERCLLSATALLGTRSGSLSSAGDRSSQHWADRNLPCQRLLVTRAGALHFLLFTAPQAQSVLVYSSSQAWCHASGMGQWRRSRRQRGRFSFPEVRGVYLAYLCLKLKAWWLQLVSLHLLRLRRSHCGVYLSLSRGLHNSALLLFRT